MMDKAPSPELFPLMVGKLVRFWCEVVPIRVF